MRRAVGGAVLACALAASPAGASTLNELPFHALPDRDAAGCLRPTGAPGGLAMFGHPAATDLWSAGGSGVARGERVRLGRLAQCAAVAEAGGAAVVASLVRRDRSFRVRAAVRDAGGAFVPMRLSAGAHPLEVAAAISPAGHAAVAWVESRGALTADRNRVRVMVARRLPGQAFGDAEPLAAWKAEDFATRPAVGIAGDGTTTVVWSQDVSDFRDRVSVAVAPPGGAFALQRFAPYSALGSAPPALAVAPDGWSLAAHDLDGSGLAVYERAPSAPRFTRLRTPTRGDDQDPAVAVVEGGGAVVAWRTGPADGDGGIAALTRVAGGSFGPPQTVVASRRREFGHSYAYLVGTGAPPFDNDADRLRTAIGPGGRVLLAWTAARRQGALSRTRTATGVLGGSFDPAQTLSTPLREAEAPAPLFLGDGRAAVAWIDNARRDGRVHLAVEGAPAQASQAPMLRVHVARTQRLFPAQAVRVTVRCDRPCDVEAHVRGADPVSVTLPAAGTEVLRLQRKSLFEIERFRYGRLAVEVRAAEHNGRAVARDSARLRVIRRPPPLLRTPLDVRAHRRGDAVVVRWRTAGPARRMYFTLLGSRTRGSDSFVDGAFGIAEGRGRTRFVTRLQPEHPGRVRWVRLTAGSIDRERLETVVVPVR